MYVLWFFSEATLQIPLVLLDSSTELYVPLQLSPPSLSITTSLSSPLSCLSFFTQLDLTYDVRLHKRIVSHYDPGYKWVRHRQDTGKSNLFGRDKIELLLILEFIAPVGFIL